MFSFSLPRVTDFHFHLLLGCSISVSNDGHNTTQLHPDEKELIINYLFPFWTFKKCLYILPNVVGTIGGSSSWNGRAHGICSVGAKRRKIIFPRILAQSS